VDFAEDDYSRRPCVDHCHRTDLVRGVICNGCNTALGMIRDNPVTAYRMSDYLDRINLHFLRQAALAA
jgi:hypothetical protein